MVILVDSKAAIQVISSNSQPKSKQINDIKQTLIHLQAFMKIVIFQWVSSHVGLEGNEMAHKLVIYGTTLYSKETTSQADSLKILLNHRIAMKYKQEADKLATTKKMERYPQNLSRIQRVT